MSCEWPPSSVSPTSGSCCGCVLLTSACSLFCCWNWNRAYLLGSRLPSTCVGKLALGLRLRVQAEPKAGLRLCVKAQAQAAPRIGPCQCLGLAARAAAGVCAGGLLTAWDALLIAFSPTILRGGSVPG